MKLKTIWSLAVGGSLSLASLAWAQTEINWDKSIPVTLTNPIVLLSSLGDLSSDNANVSVNLEQNGSGKVFGYAQIQVLGTTTYQTNVVVTTNGIVTTNALIVSLVDSNYVQLADTNGTAVLTNVVAIETNTMDNLASVPTGAGVVLSTNVTTAPPVISEVTTNEGTNLVSYATNVTTTAITYYYSTNVVTTTTITTNVPVTADLFGPVSGSVSGQAGKQSVKLSIKANGRTTDTTPKAASANVTYSGKLASAADTDITATKSGTYSAKGSPAVKITGSQTLAGVAQTVDITLDLLLSDESLNSDGTKGTQKFIGRNTIGEGAATLVGTGQRTFDDNKGTSSFSATFQGQGSSSGSSLKWQQKVNGDREAAEVNGKLSGTVIKEDVTDQLSGQL